MECWRPVVGYSRLYEVSDRGRVRSTESLRILKAEPSHNGHLRVKLYRDGRRARYYVHQLVLKAFVGPCPYGYETLHGDGNPLNNCLSNLRWGTRSENRADAKRHGTQAVGERCSFAKLSELSVRVIRRLAGRIPQREIAAIFGVSQTAITFIVTGRTWRHLATA